MPKFRITLDPPIHAPEFGEWTGDPNIALKDKHDFVQMEVECEAIESLTWFTNLVKDYTISIIDADEPEIGLQIFEA